MSGEDACTSERRSAVERRPDSDSPASTAAAAVRILELEIDGRIHEIEMLPGETIFRAAHRSELAPPFSCIAGYCGECAATLVAGEVDMKVNRVLSPRQLARGLILTCQAVPSTARCRVRFGR